MSLPKIHRVVTGHDQEGNAYAVFNGDLPHVEEIEAIPGTVFHEVWSTEGTPTRVDNGEDPTTGPLVLPPPKAGTRIRFVDIPPDTQDFLDHGADKMSAAFSQIGDEAASTVKTDSPHPLMHRTESVDYGVVIEGEVTLILDKEEILLKPGSVVVQRGTNHAWANRTDKVSRMMFVLIDGTYDPSIVQNLVAH